jgi:streptomycin 6-kinase
MSVVVRCRTADDRAAVLKLAPDAVRLGREADALATWEKSHVPELYASDRALGALLIEAIEPGTMICDVQEYPAIEPVAALLGALHAASPRPGAFPPLATLIDHLYASWDRHRHLHPELVDLVPEGLYERSRRSAARLAAEPSPAVLLHGDLTPVNVLDGGERGLVAIDPAPCIGDPAYDALDLLAWQATDLATIEGRAAALAAASGVAAHRVLDWFEALGAMFALDLVGEDNWRGKVTVERWREVAEPFLALASLTPEA